MEEAMSHERGNSVLEVLVVASIIAIVAGITVPNLLVARQRADLDALARRVIVDTMRCRFQALNRKANVGLVFARDRAGYYYDTVEDGDHDGVSRNDFARGVDRRLSPTVPFDRLCSGASLGVPGNWRVPDPSGRGWLPCGDGLRAGRSDIISFTPLGDATPATLYLTDGRDRLLAVRVYGGTARIRVLEWRVGWRRWRAVSL
jgi:type II secretory pathway pseudopilin PulG